uniref:Uncharacterized protein n=1 Tax=Solanum tuberosum TaxID=4113 RepID=M1BJI9_SOLTU
MLTWAIKITWGFTPISSKFSFKKYSKKLLNQMSNKEKLLQDKKSSSRSKRKLRLIICLLALFIPIIVAVISASIILKQQTESQGTLLHQSVISSDSCFDTIATLHFAQILSRDKINPSQIFILSLYASRIELENVATSIEKAISEVDMINPESVGELPRND